jgi:hypothetical protein
MLFTAACVALVLATGLLWGVPATWLLKGRKPIRGADWLKVSFAGLSALTVALHNLVYLNCPIGKATPWVWLGGGGLWLWFLISRTTQPRRGAPPEVVSQVRASFRAFPRQVFLMALIVYGLNGLGLFLIGAHAYFGRALGDQENYTVLAQFLTDLPFSTSWETLGHRPYLIDALMVKDDRLGAMVLQGFFASSLRADAQALFEPTALLGPALLVPAVVALARRLRLGRRPALLAGLACGLLPGLTTLHLNCFLSHTLSVSFLLMTLLALHDLTTRPGPRTLLWAGLLSAATVSLYGELAAILLGLAVVCLGGGAALRFLSVRRGLLLLLLWIVLTAALNPLYASRLVFIAGPHAFANTSDTLRTGLVHYARSLSVVWIADIWASKPGWTGRCVFGLAAVLTLFAGRGLARMTARLLAVRHWSDKGPPARRRTGPLLLGTLALVTVPLLVFAYDLQHPYQFQKLLISVSPVLVIGTAYGTRTRTVGVGATLVRWGPLATALGSGLIGTVAMALQTADPARASASSLQEATLDRDFQSAYRLLGSLRVRTVVLACGPGLFQNSWLAYSARRNDVWLVNPRVNNLFVLDLPGAPRPAYPERSVAGATQVTDLETLPAEVLLLTSERHGPQVQLEGDFRLLWASAQYRLWQLGPAPFVIRRAPAVLEADRRPSAER